MEDDDLVLSIGVKEEENSKEDIEDVKKVSFFDLFKDISNHGDYIENYFSVHKKMPKEYNAYMMNRAFSNFCDTIFIANEINKHYNITDEIQWRFYKNSVYKRKRFSKWFKKMEEVENIDLLAKIFNCSVKEMRKNIHVIPKEKLNEIIKSLRAERDN